MSVKSKRIMRIALVLIVLAALCGVMVVFVADERQQAEKKHRTPEVDRPDEQASLIVGNIRQLSRKDGKDEWFLEADSVRYIMDQQKAVFDNLSLVFFMENDQQANLTAYQGVLKTDTKNIQVSHQVIVKHEGYTFQTEFLEYLYDRKEFISNTPVTFSSELLQLSADSVVMDLNSNKLRFMGNINGALDGGLDIVKQWQF